MRKLICWFLLFLMVASSCLAESLMTLDSAVFSAAEILLNGRNSIQVNGCHIRNDTIYATSNVGIFIKCSTSTDWRKIFDCAVGTDIWWDDYNTAKKENIPFNPGLIWYDKTEEEYIVFDNYMRTLYTIYRPDSEDRSIIFHDLLERKSTLNNFCPQKDFFLFGLISSLHDYFVGVVKSDLSDYHRIFKAPKELLHKLDSVEADYYPQAAFNETNNNIWVVPEYHNYIYIVNLKGDLSDSIKIIAADFITPQEPPKSRIKSLAVSRDWSSRCSSVSRLHYVSPGYFLLQYFSDWIAYGSDSVRLSPTLCWTADGEPVELEVDKLWRLIQAQPDGRVFFAKYVYEGDTYIKTVVYVTRIES